MRLAPSDLKSLQVFRAIVEHGSFLGAQTALNIGQSAVSFHVKALEERFGFRLCRRGRGGFALTEKGALVYQRSKALFSALSTFESEIGELRHMITGTLRLGVIDNTITDTGLPVHEVVHEFLRRAPHAQLEISIGVPEQLVADVGNGGLDVAVIPETRHYDGLCFKRFYEETHSLYCAGRHPLATNRTAPAERAEVERHAFVVRPYANGRELQHFPDATVSASASNVEAQAMFILSGHFIGYLPDHFAEQWVDGGELVPLLRGSVQIASSFYIVTRQVKRPPLLLRVFVQELVSGSLARLHSEHLPRERVDDEA